LLQETISKNLETPFYETDSNEQLSGRELFQKAYSDIYSARQSDTSNLSSEIIQRFKDEHRQVLDTLNPDIETDYPIPKYGISAEVLFYLAVCSKGYQDKISPSSLYEDTMYHYDFSCFNIQLDTTCATDDSNFKQKWSEGNSPTLFIPLVPLEKMFKKGEQKGISFPYQETYQYKLIILNQKFNVDKFFKDLIDINSSITDLIVDFYRNHNSHSSYGIKNNVFGYISPGLIKQQRNLLNLLQEKLDISLDNN
jgi:hypothetical protein